MMSEAENWLEIAKYLYDALEESSGLEANCWNQDMTARLLTAAITKPWLADAPPIVLVGFSQVLCEFVRRGGQVIFRVPESKETKDV